MTETPDSNNLLWLLRINGGEILGPLATQEIKSILIKTKMTQDAELCPQNSYWFTLVDTDELKKYFSSEDVIKILHMTSDANDSGTETGGSTRSDMEATRPGKPKKESGNTTENTTGSTTVAWRQIFSTVFFLGIILAIFAVVLLLRKLNT